MSDSIPTFKVHPPKQEEDRERGRVEGEGEEVGAEEEQGPVPSLQDELTSKSQLKGEAQHRVTVTEDGQTTGGEQPEEEERRKDEQEEEERRKGAAQVPGAEADGEGEDRGGAGAGVEASKGISKVQSVFALVRNRVRSQNSADRSQGRGILGVVQQATRELVRAQGGKPATEPSQEASSGAEQFSGEGDDRGSPVVVERGSDGESTAEREQDLEVRESKGEGTGGRGGDEGGVGGGEEMLRSMEALRQELKEEIMHLRLETQLALVGMEARLTQSLRDLTNAHANTNTNAKASTTLAKQSALADMGSAHRDTDRRPRPPVNVGAGTVVTVPAGHGVRRRALYRTLTTLSSSTCPPPPLLPRSRSEPMGGHNLHARRLSNGADSAGRLPPPTQHTRKPVRSKTRLVKTVDSG